MYVISEDGILHSAPEGWYMGQSASCVICRSAKFSKSPSKSSISPPLSSSNYISGMYSNFLRGEDGGLNVQFISIPCIGSRWSPLSAYSANSLGESTSSCPFVVFQSILNVNLLFPKIRGGSRV